MNNHTVKTNQSVVKPLRKCVLRCDSHMRLIVGGTYGYTRGAGKQFHGGIDLYAEPGTEVFSIFKGSVEWADNLGKTKWGKAILTKVQFPEWTCWTLYAHLSEIYVKNHTPLESGGILIGATGITGNSDSAYPHLHFEAWKSTKAGELGTKEKYRFDPLHILGPLPFQSFASEVIERHERRNNTA